MRAPGVFASGCSTGITSAARTFSNCTVRLMKELTKAGQNDLAYKLVNHTTIPSWGYEVEHGNATTIWERWDGWTPDGGFTNVKA